MSPKQFFLDFCQRLVADGIMDMSQIRGFSDEEISEIESRTAMKLPEFYKEFLRVMGKKGGGFMKGTHLIPNDVDDIAGARSRAAQVMAKGGAEEKLPDDAFVIGDHQGYQYWYFLTNPPDDNPAVFYYRELRPRAAKVADTFTEFLNRRRDGCLADKKFTEKLRQEADALKKKVAAGNTSDGDPRPLPPLDER